VTTASSEVRVRLALKHCYTYQSSAIVNWF